MKAKMRTLLLLAILLRVLIMPFYFHPDIKTYNYQISHLQNKEFNIYKFISENRQKLSIRDDFTYYPLTYFFLGSYQILISPLLGPNFTDWLADSSSQSLEKVGVFRYLFLMKSLYLVFDIMIAFFLLKLFDNFKQKETIFKIWLFNPFSLLLIYVYSGIDILPVLLTVLGLVFLLNKKIITAAFIMGVAAAFKGYTLLFFPLLLLIGKNFLSKIYISIALLMPFLVIVFPFLPTTGFREQVLISGLTNRLFLAGFSIGFGETLMVTLIAMASLFFWALASDKQLLDPWQYLLALLLILFSTIHYHIQWLLWIIPFLVIFAVSYERFSKFAFAWLSLAFIIPFLYEDKSMSVSLLSAISPLYNLLPIPFQVIQKIYNPYTIQSIIHSFMFALSLILIGQLIRFKKDEVAN